MLESAWSPAAHDHVSSSVFLTSCNLETFIIDFFRGKFEAAFNEFLNQWIRFGRTEDETHFTRLDLSGFGDAQIVERTQIVAEGGEDELASRIVSLGQYQLKGLLKL